MATSRLLRIPASKIMDDDVHPTQSDPGARRRAALSLLLAAAALAALRVMLPERSLDATGLRALVDAFFTLGALLLFLLLCAALGQWILRWLRPSHLTAPERWLFGLPLGWGAFSLWAFALGMLGTLTPTSILLSVMGFSLLALPVSSRLSLEPAAAVRATPGRFGRAPLPAKLGGTLAAALLALGALHALSPPWSYDALMYHLEAPRRFLQAGRLLLLPEIWQANGPSLTEMLFLPGLTAGSDAFARLIHLTCGTWLAWAVFLFGRRFAPRTMGRWALWIFVGAPGLPIVAGFAYVDLAWALYGFLALYALSLTYQDRQGTGAALLAGLLMGFAMSCKVLALGSFASLGLGFLLLSGAIPWRRRVRGLTLFSGAALLTASPWYLKNLIWTGDPFYPLWLGGPGWPPERTVQLIAYLRTIGRPESGAGFLAALWSAFFSPAGRTLGVEGLSPLFLLAPLYLLVRRSPTAHLLALTSLLYGVFWALTSMQVRFLLPVFPVLSLLAAWALAGLRRLWGRSPRMPALLEGLTLVPMLLSLMLTLGVLLTLRSPSVVVGAESKRQFLRRAVFDFHAVEYLQQELPQDARVLLLWDGMSYYCGARCLPDSDQAAWTRLAWGAPDPILLARELHAEGVTHLLVSEGDAAHMMDHDPSGDHLRAYRYLVETFEPACTTPSYADEQMRLLELTCP
jgi:hypothetical protein